MDATSVNKLEARNKTLIEAVIKKIDKCCPEAVDLIGIAGSFQSGDIHEKSDLDLCIIAKDDAANEIAVTFILEGVGFDFYCSRWSRLEEMAKYNNPHVSKLFDLDIVYKRNRRVENKYIKLRDQCRSNLLNKDENLIKGKRFFNIALSEYARLILSQDLFSSRYYTFSMATNMECALYMINSTYIKKGIRRIPEEIAQMELRPSNFIKEYLRIFDSNSIDEIKNSSTRAIKLLNNYLSSLNEISTNIEISGDNLVGTYEEIYSNWKNKMHQAAKDNDNYSAFMAMSSCQKFYCELSDRYKTPNIKILQKYSPIDLAVTTRSFDEGMDELKELYMKFNKKPKEYHDISEFLDDYLKT